MAGQDEYSRDALVCVERMTVGARQRLRVSSKKQGKNNEAGGAGLPFKRSKNMIWLKISGADTELGRRHQ